MASPKTGRSRHLAVLAALAVWGCTQPPVPGDHFYRLEGGWTITAFAEPPLAGSVAVARLAADGLASERALLYSERDRPLELRQYAYHYWVEPPPRLLQDLLVGYLRAANAATSVASPDARRPAGCEVSGRIRRFEQLVAEGAPPSVLVELELALDRGNDAVELFRGNYRALRPAEDETVAAVVRAFDQALGEAFGGFLADLAARPAACPPPA